MQSLAFGVSVANFLVSLSPFLALVYRNDQQEGSKNKKRGEKKGENTAEAPPAIKT